MIADCVVESRKKAHAVVGVIGDNISRHEVISPDDEIDGIVNKQTAPAVSERRNAVRRHADVIVLNRMICAVNVDTAVAIARNDVAFRRRRAADCAGECEKFDARSVLQNGHSGFVRPDVIAFDEHRISAEILMPRKSLPEITLRSAAELPPMVMFWRFPEAARIETPILLPRSTEPVASVPIKQPSTVIFCES